MEDAKLHWSISCPPPSPLGSNWKIWVALLVCFGGMWNGLWAFPQCCCSVDRGVNGVMEVRQSLVCEAALFFRPCLLSQSAPPGSLLPADRPAGPLVYTVCCLWPSPKWTGDRWTTSTASLSRRYRGKINTTVIKLNTFKIQYVLL